MGDRRLKNLPRMRQTLIKCSSRNLADCDQAKASIEQNDSERFAIEEPHFIAHQAIDRFRLIERLGKSLGGRQTCPETECGDQLQCLGRPDSFEIGELDHRAATEEPKGAIGIKKLLRQRKNIAAWRSSAQENGQELGVGEGIDSAMKQ